MNTNSIDWRCRFIDYNKAENQRLALENEQLKQQAKRNSLRRKQ